MLVKLEQHRELPGPSIRKVTSNNIMINCRPLVTAYHCRCGTLQRTDTAVQYSSRCAFVHVSSVTHYTTRNSVLRDAGYTLLRITRKAPSHSHSPPVTSSWSIFSHRPQQWAPLLPKSLSSSSRLSRWQSDPPAAPRHRTAETQGGSTRIPILEVWSWFAGGFQISPGPDSPPPVPVKQQEEHFSTPLEGKEPQS